METNPYSSPAVHDPLAPGAFGETPVSTAAIQQLADTKPWVRFLSVLIFVGAGFLVLAAAGMLIAGAAGTAMAMPGRSSGFPAGMGVGLAILYALLAFLYIFPGIKLWKYADHIAVLVRTRRDSDLVAALDQQRSFWKFVGIMTIITLVIYVFVIVAVVITAAAGAARLH
jgi:hypothetical protein